MRSTIQSVLIVENDGPTRELYSREIKREYRVFAYAGERGVLDLLLRQEISAIVLEPSWPNGRGWDLLAAIRRAPAGRGIPLILCSTLDARACGMRLGASAYLVKPVLPAALLETIRRVMPSQDQR